jgi:hypothetical protein
VRPDPEIERLEADLARSRFEKWEVETLLADRHRAKIEALERPRSKLAFRWRVFRELTDPVFLYVGWVGSFNVLVLWSLGVF